MFSKLKTGIVTLGLIAGPLLAGCQSGGAGTSTPSAMSMQAVQCDKCQTTMVNTPTSTTAGQGGGITVYSPHKEMDCPDCKTAAASFFAGGKLQPTCKACGGNMKICDAH